MKEGTKEKSFLKPIPEFAEMKSNFLPFCLLRAWWWWWWGGRAGESGGVSVLRRPRLTLRLRGHSWRTLVLRTLGAGEDTKRVKHQNDLEGNR